MGRKLTLFINCVLMLWAAAVQAAEDNPHDHHNHNHDHDHARVVKKPMGNTQEYSCNLVRFAGICRQYQIAVNATETLAELKEGCESMEDAGFEQAACPARGQTAKCMDIVRNYHKPDVIYNNYYYGTLHSRWNEAEVRRVCGDLEGEFIVIKPTKE